MVFSGSSILLLQAVAVGCSGSMRWRSGVLHAVAVGCSGSIRWRSGVVAARLSVLY